MANTQPIVLPAQASDSELVRRVAGGETAAFEALMRRHNRTLFRTARAILRDDAEAEDALQEAYLQDYQAMGGFRWFTGPVRGAAAARAPRAGARRGG